MKVPEYVYYENSKGQKITGVFHNWKVLGVASLNSTTSNSVEVTLEGSTAILVANYSELKAYDTVNIVPSISGEPIEVSIDGITYTVTNQTSLSLPAGFANVTIITTQFNSSANNKVIHHYCYSEVSYGGKTYTTLSMLLFLPPQTTPTIYLDYVNNFNYYYITLKSVNSSGDVVIYLNGTQYNYNSSVWIKGGSYTVSPTGIFYGIYSCGATEMQVEYQNGSTFTYYYPNIPNGITINQPLKIVVYYGVTDYFQPL
jgi:hypothetical protein